MIVIPLWYLTVPECVLATRQSYLGVGLQSSQESWVFYLKTENLTVTYWGTTLLHLQKGSSLLSLPFALAIASVMNFLEQNHTCVSSLPWTDTFSEGCFDGNIRVPRSLMALTLSVRFDLNRVRWELVGPISSTVLKHRFSYGSFT